MQHLTLVLVDKDIGYLLAHSSRQSRSSCRGASPFLTQFETMEKLYKGTLDPIFQITYKDIKQHWAQYWFPEDSTCDRLPLWKGPTCCHPVGASFQPIAHHSTDHWPRPLYIVCLQEWSARQDLSKDFQVWSFHQPEHSFKSVISFLFTKFPFMWNAVVYLLHSQIFWKYEKVRRSCPTLNLPHLLEKD